MGGPRARRIASCGSSGTLAHGRLTKCRRPLAPAPAHHACCAACVPPAGASVDGDRGQPAARVEVEKSPEAFGGAETFWACRLSASATTSAWIRTRRIRRSHRGGTNQPQQGLFARPPPLLQATQLVTAAARSLACASDGPSRKRALGLHRSERVAEPCAAPPACRTRPLMVPLRHTH